MILFVGIIEAAFMNGPPRDHRGEVKAPTQENLAELGALFH